MTEVSIRLARSLTGKQSEDFLESMINLTGGPSVFIVAGDTKVPIYITEIYKPNLVE